ncbi:MAG: AMP-binding protein, partial [Burkholderiales bacterium]
MTIAVIDKIARETDPLPNLRDYPTTYASFSWSHARAELDGLPHGRGLNIAHETIDRHVAHGRGGKVALRWLAKDGSRHDFTYSALSEASSRFADVLRHLGVSEGDRVFALAGRIPALYIAALGTWKAKGVFCTMFSAFGPEPIRSRMTIGGAKVLITTASLYEKKIAPIRASLGSLAHVLLVDEDATSQVPPGTLSYASLMAKASNLFEIPATAPEDPALLHFTSGTTGTPKGAVHVHEAVVAHHITGKLALDLHVDDIFWCTADPGWVTGTSYGIIAPLTNGVTSIVDEQDFDAERWYEILEQQAVSVWYTAPTAIRMMMKAGLDLARARRLPALRFLASVGEPLNP